jgi:hypothetical protein
MSGNGTLLLDGAKWDIVADLTGNIAVAEVPYSQAQDAASALRTFQGEVFYDKVYGVPYWTRILGQAPPLSLVKAYWIAAAKTVPGVVSAKAFIASFVNRTLTGQVQITNRAGETSASGF